MPLHTQSPLSETSNKIDSIQSSTKEKAYALGIEFLLQKHPEIGQALLQELESQRQSLKLTASENYSSIDIQLAIGNIFTDKYAEGIPGCRFYSGCNQVDAIESYAASLATKLFQAYYAYVQPHSGSDANFIAYGAALTKRIENTELIRLHKSLSQLSSSEYESIRQKFSQAKILALSLKSGGHLTHGSRMNLSSKMMRSIYYEVNSTTGLIDYKEVEQMAMRERPDILMAGFSAYPGLINFAYMKEIAKKSHATLIVDMAHFAGLVAGKAFTGDFNPIPFADIVTSTTHKTLRGPRGGLILCTKEYQPFIAKGCPMFAGGPAINIIAAKAICFKEALQPSFSTYAQQTILNAQILAQHLKEKGAAVLSGTTENHMILLDVTKSFGLTGKAAEDACTQIGLYLNRNLLPNDPHGAKYCSGIRIGTPAVTTRGLKEKEMQKIGDILYDALKKATPSGALNKKDMECLKSQVQELLSNFPLYPEIRSFL